MTISYGVHSEAGKLRRVLVHTPGAAMSRLTPDNCAGLLFDDVIWVKQARIVHVTFVDAVRNRGVEVVFLHQLLTETPKDLEARRWLLEARISDNAVGVGLSDDLTAHLMEVDADLLSTILIGGMSRAELPIPVKGGLAPMLQPADFTLPPLPNHIFTRDTTCWIYGGVMLNPMHWPVGQLETLNLAAIYRFHPDFKDAGFPIWWGDPMQDHGPATVEGGDVMPIGGGTVLVGMGERTTPQAVSQIARGLFAASGARRVIACQFPRSRSAMHLDIIFTYCDCDLVTVFAEVTDAIQCYSLRAGKDDDVAVETETKPFLEVVANALSLKNLRGCSFVKLLDFTPDEIRHLLQLAASLKMAKAGGYEVPMLEGKNIALILEKDSTRTRSGSEVAAYDQGAHVTYLGPSGNHIGHKETMKDTARVLGRLYDGIAYRGFGQNDSEVLAKFSGVQVFNRLTDDFHPTQILADLMRSGTSGLSFFRRTA